MWGGQTWEGAYINTPIKMLFKSLHNICSLIHPNVSRRFLSLLQVQLPHQVYGEPFQLSSSSDLQSHPSSPLRNTKNELTISLWDIVSEGNRFHVYRGKMDTLGSPDIIAKVAVNDAGAEAWVLHLEEEAWLYCNELRHLQGWVVPRFFGFYTGMRQRELLRWDVVPTAHCLYNLGGL